MQNGAPAHRFSNTKQCSGLNRTCDTFGGRRCDQTTVRNWISSGTFGPRSVEPALTQASGVCRCECATAETGTVKTSNRLWAQPDRQHVQQYSYTYANFVGCKATEHIREPPFIYSHNERTVLERTKLMPDPVYQWFGSSMLSQLWLSRLSIEIQSEVIVEKRW